MQLITPSPPPRPLSFIGGPAAGAIGGPAASASTGSGGPRTLQWLVSPEDVVLLRLNSEAAFVRPHREQPFSSTPSAAAYGTGGGTSPQQLQYGPASTSMKAQQQGCRSVSFPLARKVRTSCGAGSHSSCLSATALGVCVFRRPNRLLHCRS